MHSQGNMSHSLRQIVIKRTGGKIPTLKLSAMYYVIFFMYVGVMSKQLNRPFNKLVYFIKYTEYGFKIFTSYFIWCLIFF